MDFNNSPMSRHENPSMRQNNMCRWADRHDKANRHFLQISKHINSMWIIVSYWDNFINDPTDGIQHSRLLSKMEDRAAIATIPPAISGSPYILV
jgi:hypothetical protein